MAPLSKPLHPLVIKRPLTVQDRLENMTVVRKRLTIYGVVQGVGFRPHAVQKARLHAVTGWVTNTDAGVIVEAQGAPDEVDRALADITTDLPPLAFISYTNVQSITPINGENSLSLIHI